MSNTVYLNGETLSIHDVINVAENNYTVEFPKGILEKISEFRKGLEEYGRNHKIYGYNTGCGDLIDVDITPQSLKEYQRRYIMAHNCGTGDPLPPEIVRAIMVIRLNSFAKGYSAVRAETCQLMMDMLNKGVSPWVLEEGSVGASGDLVPLAMIGAVLIGLPEAKAYYKNKLMSALGALRKANLASISLAAKEAMALTNGSNLIAALAVFAVRDAEKLLKNASISAALSLEAIRGEKEAFSEFIAEARPHEGQKRIAAQIRKLLEGSKRTTIDAQKYRFSEKENFNAAQKERIYETGKERVQDRYSFRCIPQVHGPVYEAIQKVKEIVSIEINSATDNPLLFKDDTDGTYKAKSGGNFHGQPLAVVIDYLKIALTGLALITNKRVFSILDKFQSYGLPQDLAADPSGGDTGLMIAQYAGAARVAESRILSTPASIMSISTGANQEDFVSMGSIGALHLRKIIYNTQIVIAIEFLCALRGLQLTSYDSLPENMKALGKGTSEVYNFLNNELPPVGKDTYLRNDIEKVIKLVRSGKLVCCASMEVGQPAMRKNVRPLPGMRYNNQQEG